MTNMPPTFILVRHGEAEHNVGFRAQGESAYENPIYRDSPLTEVGIEQVNNTRHRLESLSIVDVWSSPLTRCIQTAEGIRRGENQYVHDSLLERLGGGHVCNERKSKFELQRLCPNWSTKYLPENPPSWDEREPIQSVRSRVFGLLAFLREYYRELPETDHILVVTHHDAIESITETSLRNADYVLLR